MLVKRELITVVGGYPPGRSFRGWRGIYPSRGMPFCRHLEDISDLLHLMSKEKDSS